MKQAPVEMHWYLVINILVIHEHQSSKYSGWCYALLEALNYWLSPLGHNYGNQAANEVSVPPENPAFTFITVLVTMIFGSPFRALVITYKALYSFTLGLLSDPIILEDLKILTTSWKVYG